MSLPAVREVSREMRVYIDALNAEVGRLQSQVSSLESVPESVDSPPAASTPSPAAAVSGSRSYDISGTDDYDVPLVDGAIVTKRDSDAQEAVLASPRAGVRMVFVYEGDVYSRLTVRAPAGVTIWSSTVSTTPVAARGLQIDTKRGAVEVVGTANGWAAWVLAGTASYVS